VEQPKEVLAVDRVVGAWPLRVTDLQIVPFERVFEN